jgi:ubiquinone/menaquinone biosynthesis C-methylase UbiE
VKDEGWNRNVHYHDVILRSIPPRCKRALDVGCGEGLLARKLARFCEDVVAVDVHHETLSRAKILSPKDTRVSFLETDVMTHPFADESFDVITLVAALHHLPLEPALIRMDRLLKPGGVLAVVGLYRLWTMEDYLVSAIALPTSYAFRFHYGYSEVAAPMKDPKETLHQIRSACDELLPGAVLRRKLLFRYSLVWRKP